MIDILETSFYILMVIMALEGLAIVADLFGTKTNIVNPPIKRGHEEK